MRRGGGLAGGPIPKGDLGPSSDTALFPWLGTVGTRPAWVDFSSTPTALPGSGFASTLAEVACFKSHMGLCEEMPQQPARSPLVKSSQVITPQMS